MIVAVLGWGCMSASASAAPTPEYFNLPGGLQPGAGIVAAPDGTVWFPANPVATPNPSLGRLVPAQATAGTTNGISIFPTPLKSGTGCCANQVRSVAYDTANDRVWFVQSDGIVGWANPANVVPNTSAGMTDTLLPGLQDLWDIAVGANGTAWFTEHSASNVGPTYTGNRIAAIGSSLGVSESDNLALQGHGPPLDSLRYDAKPAGITTAPDGTPWFAEADPGNPGYRIARANGTGYVEYPIAPCLGTPCSGSYTGTGPTDVAVAQDGAIWFTNQLHNEVGRLDTKAGTFTNYSLPALDAALGGGQARAISLAQDGTLWVAEYGSFTQANAIVRIVPSLPSPTATVWHLGTAAGPLAVAPDTHGNVWFTMTNGTVGRLAGVVGAATVPGTTTPGGGTSPGPAPGTTVLTPASVGKAKIGTPATDGTSVTVDQICVGPPQDRCSLVYIVSAHEYVTGFPGTHARAASVGTKKKAKIKAVILGQKAVTLKGGQHRKVTIALNAKGRAMLKRAGRLTLYFSVTEKRSGGQAPKRIKSVKVTFRAKAKRHR